MSELSHGILQNILRAQTVDGVPPSEPIVSHTSIGALLETQVDQYEDKIFLIFYDDGGHRKEFSYRELYEEVCKTANFLKAKGIGPGDRIATVSHNHSDVVIQYFAAFLLGAVVVPINIGEDDKRITYILSNSNTKLAFVRDEYVERIVALQDDVPSMKVIVQCGSRKVTDIPFYPAEISQLPARFSPSKRITHDDEALIVYTSGTTGLPKGVVLNQYNLLVDAHAITDWHRLSDDQRMMCVLPIHHVNGTVVTLMTPLYCGGSVVLNQRFRSEKFFERISIEKVHVVSVVPTLLQFLLHAKIQLGSYILGQFRHIICGAGPLTVDLAMKFEDHFNIRIVHGYGLSETTCYSCFLPIDLERANHKRWLSKYGFPSIGVAMPVNEMTIHDERGNEINEGERGEIVIRGHNVMKGYFENPEANEKTFAHGWFRSGDEGFYQIDDEGRKFFFITGRLKELIIRGGVNISPFEIDEVLMNIPGVAAGIAVGFENEWYGEEVGAYVKPKDGLTLSEKDILGICRKQLPFSKAPKVVIFGDDLPVTSTGKYQRNKCKHLFAKWKAVQFNEKRGDPKQE